MPDLPPVLLQQEAFAKAYRLLGASSKSYKTACLTKLNDRDGWFCLHKTLAPYYDIETYIAGAFFMDLTGFYRILLPRQEPQSIQVRKVGPLFIFSFEDLLDRKIHVEGKHEGYNVTLFQSRDLFHLTKFTVKGRWEAATYRDWRGRFHNVEILGGED